MSRIRPPKPRRRHRGRARPVRTSRRNLMRPEIPGQQPATDTRAEVQRVVENGRGQQPVQEAIEHRDLTPEEQKERTAMQVRRAIALLVASLVVGGLIALEDGGSLDLYDSADSFDDVAENVDLEKNEINAKAKARVLLYEPDPRVISLLSKNFDKNDPLIKGDNCVIKGFSSKIKVRSTTNDCFQVARSICQEMGYDIVGTSGYRSEKMQKKLYPKWYQPWRWKRRGKVVAKPGRSPHQTGGAIDCALVRLSDGKRVTYFDFDNQKNTQYTDALEFCMNRAGFVRYKGEIWHFEIGTKDWVTIMQKLGSLPKGKAPKSKYRYNFIKD